MVWLVLLPAAKLLDLLRMTLLDKCEAASDFQKIV